MEGSNNNYGFNTEGFNTFNPGVENTNTTLNTTINTGVNENINPGFSAVPARITFLTKVKNFLFQDITLDLTPKQEKVFKEVHDFWHQEITGEKLHNFLFQEISFGKKK